MPSSPSSDAAAGNWQPQATPGAADRQLWRDAFVSGEIPGRVVALLQVRSSIRGQPGTAYADLGQVEKAIALLEQALAVGRHIQDPRIISITPAALARPRGETAP